MNTKELLRADFAAIVKRSKRGKDKTLTPAEEQLVADKEAAKSIVGQCCGTCVNEGDEEKCGECYTIYDNKLKRFWLARYVRRK